MSPLSIAVIGAGPAGLATAAFLADAGHRPVLFERFAAPRPIGAGLLLQPSGLAVLARLGLGPTIAQLGSPIRRIYGRAIDSGATVFDIGYHELDPALHGCGIHRASLFAALWSAVEARGVAVETNAEIVALDRDGGRPVLIDAQSRRFGPFDLAVDAAGGRSALRRALGEARERPFPYGAVWGIARNTGFAPDCLTQRYVGATHMIGVLPVGRLPDGHTDCVALFWSLKVAQHSAWAADFADWKAEVARLWPETAPLVAQFEGPEKLTLAAYGQVTLRRPYGDRLAVVGDAAHATSPQLGQGANLAMLDAAALADSLRDHDVEAGLRAYAARRRGHVRFYQAASALMTPFFQSDSRLAARIRDLVLPRLPCVPYLRREMVRTLAGLKTGLFTHESPEQLAGGPAAVIPAEPVRSTRESRDP